MTTLSATSHLHANLDSLGERNADLAARLRSVEPAASLHLFGSAQGVPTASYEGRQLCSRHRPLDEAATLVDSIDLVEHAVVVVLGFGMGYHLRRLAERSAKATLLVVFEPDLALLRGVLEQADHSSWLTDALVIIVTDADDRGQLARLLEGAESILAQGVHFLEHPPSRARLAHDLPKFSKHFSEHLTAAKTTLITTLMRSVDTVRNLMLNLDHYAAGPGIAELRNAAAGFSAVVVSAGPSLHKNIKRLAEPGVRERCVIIAVQTTLKPLLDAGVRPHFVTALDYHEISRRFYENLDAERLRDVTLVADPKAHPVILDSFPGPVRCAANSFLDKLLGGTEGPLYRDMGELPAGATVAHLAVYLANYLGCNPIAMIGQDLGFPDGLYYAPGTAIHEVWAPELNPFNTVAMMEWQRIARHRLHLIKTVDVDGKSIYTDVQMHTYRQQFERDFARLKGEGVTIIDATEGGVAKQHATSMTLERVLRDHATRPLPRLPLADASALDAKRMQQSRQHLGQVRGDILRLRQLSQETAKLIERMMEEQDDQTRLAIHFRQIEKNRQEVEQRFAAFELLNHMNQLGVYRRLKADRRLHMQKGMDAVARQRGQLRRDLDNVSWIADAGAEMLDQLAGADRLLAGQKVEHRGRSAADLLADGSLHADAVVSRVAALIPVDFERNGLLEPRSSAERWQDRTVLQATLERLGQSQELESIVLIVPRGNEPDVECLIDRAAIALPVAIEHCEGSPYRPEHAAIAAARWWADSCWRGGIAGMSVYDEVLCPRIMHETMQRRGLTAALLVGPDWPLVQVIGDQGCDAVIRRHREHPQQNNLVFTQSPPGLCGCLVSATLMAELAQRNRLSTVGGLLVYQPHAPQHDPIAREVNVQIDHEVRRSLGRFIADSPERSAVLASLPRDAAAATIVAAQLASASPPLPHHLTLELTTRRASCGLFARSFHHQPRPDISLDLVERLFASITHPLLLTLAGAGDPLLHPHFDRIVALARQSSVRGIHLRTELLCDRATIDRLLACPVDVVSVDLNADRAATYQAMMGVDRFKDALQNVEYLLDHRRPLTNQPGTAALALPWVVPHLQRRAETYEDIDTFFDRWQHMLGTAVIEDPFDADDCGLTPAITPARVIARDRNRCLTMLCDGGVPLDHRNFSGREILDHLTSTDVADHWRRLRQRSEGERFA